MIEWIPTVWEAAYPLLLTDQFVMLATLKLPVVSVYFEDVYCGHLLQVMQQNRLDLRDFLFGSGLLARSQGVFWPAFLLGCSITLLSWSLMIWFHLVPGRSSQVVQDGSPD